MKLSPAAIGVFVVIAITVGAGALHGKLTNRWGKTPNMKLAAEKLESLPLKIGAWESSESTPFADNVMQVLQCSGYINRMYVHNKTNERVSLAILLGPPGPISVHTPEVCYPSLNLDVDQATVRQQLRNDHPDEEFSTVAFRSRGLDGQRLRVWYGWSDGGPWRTPNLPRVTFSAAPMLFKLQVAAPIEVGGSGSELDACRRFLTDLLPVLDTLISSEAAQSTKK